MGIFSKLKKMFGGTDEEQEVKVEEEQKEEEIEETDESDEDIEEEIDEEVDLVKEKLGIDITETSDLVNDTFLKTNGESGVESYHVPDSVYVRFYLTYAGSKNV